MQPSHKPFLLSAAGLLLAPTMCYAHGEQGIEIVAGQAGVTLCFLVAALIGRKTWQSGVCLLVLAASVLSWPVVMAIWGNLLPDVAVLTAIVLPLVIGALAYFFTLRRKSSNRP